MSGPRNRIEKQLAEQRLWPLGTRVVIAVSGGVDSMVLLHVLHSLAVEQGWKCSVAHFNHQLRGRSSAADERFVRAAARRLNLPCDVGTGAVRQVAKRRGHSIEMAAREMRHAFLAGCAGARRARVVALAHHADDQVELFFLRLLRGAGGDGLGGMKRRSVSPADRSVTLVRPLLDFFKAEIEGFAREQGIKFREDQSNASAEFERNWVRHELLPLLRTRQPALGKNVLRTMRVAGADADYATQAAEAWLNLRGATGGAGFESLHVAVQRRLLRQQIRDLGMEPDFQLIEELRLGSGKAVSVGTNSQLAMDSSGRVDCVKAEIKAFAPGTRLVELRPNSSKARAASGKLDFDGVRLEWRIKPVTKRLKQERRNDGEVFDADKVGAHMLLRHWRAGDRFQPLGLPAPTKLQDWFTNRKVPAPQRRQLVVAETERGEVFWVEGERIAEACKVTPTTRRLLKLRWKRL